MAKNHEISVYFSTKAIFAYVINFEIQNVLVSKRRMLINFEPLKPDEDKTFSGSLVLDLRIC